jgi:hypothetical protein
MRNSNQLDIGLLYTYAQSQGLKLDPNQFMLAMQFADVQELIEHLDRKFELTSLFDKDNNFVKIVQ